MKIVFLNFYSGHIFRGGETFVNELATRLSISNTVYVFQGGPATGREKYTIYQKKVYLPPIWPDDNLPTTHLLKRLFLHYYKRKELLFTLKSLPDIIKIKPDIIIPLNSGWQALICSLLARFLGAKLIIAGQSGPGWDDRWNLLVKPDVFITLTNSQLNWTQKASIWQNQSVIVIPNGVDTKKFSTIGNKAKITLKHPIFIIVASPISSKRVEQTIKAVAKIKSASLLLLGKGTLDKQVDDLGNRFLSNRFLHLNVSHDEIPPYYRSSDVFTLCSESGEAFGIVYLEAMASGLPCVATDDASRHEIINDAGLYVKNPNNQKEYTQTLKNALKTKWANKPITQARKFNWDKIAQAYTQLFQKILGTEN